MIAPADASRPGILVGRRFDKNGEGSGVWILADGKTVFVTFSGEAPQFFDAATGAPRSGPSTESTECCSTGSAWRRDLTPHSCGRPACPGGRPPSRYVDNTSDAAARSDLRQTAL